MSGKLPARSSETRDMTLQYFGRLSVGEVAAALGVFAVTVERDWRLARAWLRSHLRGDES